MDSTSEQPAAAVPDQRQFLAEAWSTLKNLFGPPHWHSEYEEAEAELRAHERGNLPPLQADAAKLLLELTRENWTHHVELLASQEERQDSLCKFAGGAIAAAAASFKAFDLAPNQFVYLAAIAWSATLVIGLLAQLVFQRYPRPPRSMDFRLAFSKGVDPFELEEIAAGSLHLTCIGLRVNIVRRRRWLAVQYVLLAIGFGLLTYGFL